MEPREKLHGAVVVTEAAEDALNRRQYFTYRDHRREFIDWLWTLGKDPEYGEGYAKDTVRNRAYRLDKFYRWVWSEEGYFVEPEDITPAHADDWMKHLANTEYKLSYKTDLQKAPKVLFKWQSWKRNTPVEWDPDINYHDPTHNQQPRDFLTLRERKLLRAAALEHGSLPPYDAVTPEERKDGKRLLAERFGKPMDAISSADWERANGWKIPSLVWTSLDAGLRPVEVRRARVSWVDLQNGVLRIPMEESTKNRDNWTIGLRDRTARALERWLEERENREKYEDVEWLWLNQRGNRYRSASLNYLFRKLCDEAGIQQEHRDISWYSIRRSTATYMAREEDLAAAAAQLRHKSTRTTMRYDQAPVEDRKEALERMG